MHGLVDLVIKTFESEPVSRRTDNITCQKIKDNDLQNSTQETEISNKSLKTPNVNQKP